MKKLLVLTALLCSPALAYAKSDLADNSTICDHAISISTVSVSSGTAVKISPPVLADRKLMEFQNIDVSSAVFCRSDSGVTVGHGWKIAANGTTGDTWKLPIKDIGYSVAISTYSPYRITTTPALDIYCVSGLASGASEMVIFQCK